MPVRTTTTLECELTGVSAAISGPLEADASNLPHGWTLVQITQIRPNGAYQVAVDQREQQVEAGIKASLEQLGREATEEEIEAGRDAIRNQLEAMQPLPPEILKRTILAALSPGNEAKLLKALDGPDWVDVDADGDDDDDGEGE
jgi:hypothetical protein